MSALSPEELELLAKAKDGLLRVPLTEAADRVIITLIVKGAIEPLKVEGEYLVYRIKDQASDL